MPHLTIGTAGHVDHGKSALVEALTGTHPDRLEEEQNRGMTIDLGFAFMQLPDLGEIPIIDVPGHERFLKTMVSGVSGIHLVLFIIAADEGVMPQTLEHFGTVKYLGVERGIVVLTKCDLVDEEWMMLVEDDVKSLVQGSFLEDAPVMQVSSISGAGIEDLKSAIAWALTDIPEKKDHGIFRMPIDRVFSMKGFGTVIAGTVQSGVVSTDDQLELLPSGDVIRLRGMQTNNHDVTAAETGQRVALNVANMKVSDLQRGQEVVRPGYLKPTMMIDARLHALDTNEKPIENRIRIRLHKGTSETIGRLVLLDTEELDPGASCLIQFRLESPIVAERTERFIIRGFSSMRLIGGGEIINVYPQKHKRFKKSDIDYLNLVEKATPRELIEAVMANTFGMEQLKTEEELLTLTNLELQIIRAEINNLISDGVLIDLSGRGVIHRDRLGAIKESFIDRLSTMHEQYRLKDFITKEMLKNQLKPPIQDIVFERLLVDLTGDGTIEQRGNEIKLSSHEISLSVREKNLLTLIDELQHLASPVLSMNDLMQLDNESRPEDIKMMVAYAFDQGILIEFSDKMIIHQAALEKACSKLVSYLKQNGTVRAAEFREHLDISRAHATALLDYFCDEGITYREAGTHRLAYDIRAE